MNLIKQKSLLFVCLLLGHTAMVLAGSMYEFRPGDYQQILSKRQGKPFIMLFWSIDCAPCHKELAMLGQLRQQQPGFDVVLISTDQEVDHQLLQSVLLQHQLQYVDSWVFGDESSVRIRFEIDPAWYGELPRSYLFDRQHRRQAISGLLSGNVLASWLKGN